MAATSASSLILGPRLGLGTKFHCTPSQCMVNVTSGEHLPTAHTSLGAMADTPNNTLVYWPGLGLGTILHCTPSQCSIKVRTFAPIASYNPTAQTSFADSADTL